MGETIANSYGHDPVPSPFGGAYYQCSLQLHNAIAYPHCMLCVIVAHFGSSYRVALVLSLCTCLSSDVDDNSFRCAPMSLSQPASSSDRPAKKVRTGGRLQQHQKRKREETATTEHAPTREVESNLCKTLIEDWSWGLASAVHVQQRAMSAYMDQVSLLERVGLPRTHISADLVALKSLGSDGKWEGNVDRELKALMGPANFVEPSRFSMWQKITKPRSSGKTFSEVDTEVILPHLLFSRLYKTEPEKFADRFVGPADGRESRLQSFWEEVVRREDPRLIGHPMLTKHNWMRRAIPLALHGDAVPVVLVGKPGSESWYCFSIQSLLARGSSLKVKFLLHAVFENNKCKGHEGREGTMASIWKILTWSFKSLADGTFPARDVGGNLYSPTSSEGLLAGDQLCSDEEPFFAVLWSIKADLDWYGKSLGIRKYQSNAPCDYCCANGWGPESWSPMNFAPDSPWRASLRDRDTWRATMPDTTCTLFRDIEYLSCHNVECDELHVLHLGVCQWFMGSVLWALTFEVLKDSPKTNFEVVWEDIREEFYRYPNSSYYTTLSITSFCKGEH